MKMKMIFISMISIIVLISGTYALLDFDNEDLTTDNSINDNKVNIEKSIDAEKFNDPATNDDFNAEYHPSLYLQHFYIDKNITGSFYWTLEDEQEYLNSINQNSPEKNTQEIKTQNNVTKYYKNAGDEPYIEIIDESDYHEMVNKNQATEHVDEQIYEEY